jgi:DNA repair protein RadC
LHNYPSGEVEPSEDDAKTIERLKKAGEIIGIEMLDHIIFTKDKKFYSYRSSFNGF